MTGLIVIDESGDLGPNGTRFFSIAAIIAFRSRDLKRAANILPKNSERKWHNSLPQQRTFILETMSHLKFKVVYTIINKNNPHNSEHIYGNELYKRVLKQVISDSMDCLLCKDVNVMLDRNSFVSNREFRNIVFEEARIHNINVLKADTISSDQSKCIQLVDFIAGASRAKLEYGDNTIDIITDKVSLARRH